MTQKFRVLWIEDQLRDLISQREELREDAFEAHGVELVFEDVDNARDDTIERLAKQQELYHDFDFVILDYNLGGQSRDGAHAAARLRSSFGFVPMIFYSGTEVRVLRERLTEADVDGVHCIPRSELVTYLKYNLEDMLHPTNRLDTVRGAFMALVADCDRDLRRWIDFELGQLNDEDRRTADAKLWNNLKESAKRRLTKAEADAATEARLAMLDSLGLSRIARTIWKFRKVGPEVPEAREIQVAALDPRNTMGHAVSERIDSGLRMVGHGGLEITSETLAGFRRDAAAIRARLAEIAKQADEDGS